MKPQKKNKFFTFLWSFLPGAAEMYMGFMKNGISLMAVFFLSLIVPFVLQINDAFILVAALLWFYGFFHARNMAAASEEEFELLEDAYIWEEFTEGREWRVPGKSVRKWCAALLIVFGVLTLWQNLSEFIYHLIPDEKWATLSPLVHQIPQIVIALVLIGIGVRMIMGKKETMKEEEDGERF